MPLRRLSEASGANLPSFPDFQDQVRRHRLTLALGLPIIAVILCGADVAPGKKYALGEVAHGISVILDEQGNLDFQAAQEIELFDGTKLARDVNNKWKIITDRADTLPFVEGIDFVVDPERYMGKRIRIRGGYISSSTAIGAELLVQGGEVYIAFSGMEPSSIKAMIQTCSSAKRLPDCRYDLIATVTRGFLISPELTAPIIAANTSAHAEHE
jgi:hypothetical protein